MGELVRDRLDAAARRVVEFGRVVRSVEASADGRAWLLELAPCGHVVHAGRSRGQLVLPLALRVVRVCTVCELAAETPPAAPRITVEVIDQKGGRS
jgi:hypothetical protein